jgi:hypothetical protein
MRTVSTHLTQEHHPDELARAIADLLIEVRVELCLLADDARMREDDWAFFVTEVVALNTGAAPVAIAAKVAGLKGEESWLEVLQIEDVIARAGVALRRPIRDMEAVALRAFASTAIPRDSVRLVVVLGDRLQGMVGETARIQTATKGVLS